MAASGAARLDGWLEVPVERQGAGCDGRLRFEATIPAPQRVRRRLGVAVILCQGFPEGATGKAGGAREAGVRGHIRSPAPPGEGKAGGEARRRLRDGVCSGGRSECCLSLREGLQAGKAPWVKSVPCPLVGGTC